MEKSKLKQQLKRSRDAGQQQHPDALSNKQRKKLRRQAAAAAAAADDDDQALEGDELRELSELGFDDALAAGLAFEQMESFEGAIAAFQAAVKARPTDLRALGHLADVFAAAEQPREALETYTRATKLSDADSDASLWFRRGLAQLALEQHAGADESFRKALAISAAAMEARGDEASGSDGEDHMKAYSVTLAALANCYGEQGDIDGAVTLYRDAVTKYSENANLHYNLATMLMAKGDAAKQVVTSLERAIQCSPETTEFYEEAIEFAKADGSAKLMAKVDGWQHKLDELVAAKAAAAKDEKEAEAESDNDDDASSSDEEDGDASSDDDDDDDDDKEDEED